MAATFGVCADGFVLVGCVQDENASSRAFLWTQAGGMASVDTLNGGNSSEARGVNADGSVVVGFADDGAAQNESHAFRWTQASGMVKLGDAEWREFLRRDRCER